MQLTASDIVSFISELPRNRQYHYINPRTRTVIKIDEVVSPEGPIVIKRYNPNSQGTPERASTDTISSNMIWRVANAFAENRPINFDRVLGASYNTRSALEALLAHTPQFYYCYPGRIESISSRSQVQRGHKHLLWCPSDPHVMGVVEEKEINMVISEIPTQDAIYEALTIPEIATTNGIDIEIARRHAQIQIALVLIGRQLGFRTWVAANDRSIEYNGNAIAEMDSVVPSLDYEPMVNSFEGARRAASLIDCVWFKNGRLMPAVMEIEHSTGVTRGLVRMKAFKDTIPPVQTRYVIVAPDDLRHKVVQEANKEQFQDLDTRYFPYSSVEELYALCQRRHLKGVTEEFLDCFMEPVVRN